jgi:hypothetical protein
MRETCEIACVVCVRIHRVHRGQRQENCSRLLLYLQITFIDIQGLVLTDIVFDFGPLDTQFTYMCTLNRATFATDLNSKYFAYSPDLLVPGFIRIWPALVLLGGTLLLRPCISYNASWHDVVAIGCLGTAAYYFYIIFDLLNTWVCYQQWWKGAPLLAPVMEWHLYILAALVGALSIELRAAVGGVRPQRQAVKKHAVKKNGK